MLKGIRSQITILSILPPAIVAISIGLFLNFSHGYKVQSFFYAQGSTSIRQITTIAKYLIINHQLHQLQSITNASLEENGLRSISIFDSTGKEIAHSGPRLSLIEFVKQSAYSNEGLSVISEGEVIAFLHPIKKGYETNDAHLFNTIDNNNNVLGWVVIEYNTHQFKSQRYNESLKLNIILFFGFLLSILFGYLFSQRITRDFQNIKKSIKLFADDSSIPTYTNRYAISEFNDVNQALHEMAEIKQAEFDELRLNVELTSSDLQQTIETIEVQNIELSIAQKEALKASRIKSEFLANTSHEIRTPLNGIIGFTRILQKTPLSPQQLDYLETIQVSSEGLLTIINDILDFSKLEANKLELDYAPLNLRDCLEEVVSLLAPAAYDKALELTLTIHPEVPLNVISDSTRIKQIFFNLLSNAVKFTNSGDIIVRIEPGKALNNTCSLKCSVSDTGIGMSMSQQEDLFQAFYQANSSISREYGGTGLGLTIVKTLIKLLNGDISVQSSPSKGTQFDFTINIELQNKALPAREKVLSNFSVALITAHKPTQSVIKDMLEKFGLHVQTLESVNDLEETLSLFHIDGIIHAFSSSVQALQLVQTIERYRQPSKLPIIAVTALSLEHLTLLHEKGIIHCSKPVREHTLHRALMNALSPKSSAIETYPLLLENNFSSYNLQALIVDDNQANLHLLAIILNDLGIATIEAKDGLEATKLANDTEFDIIFMDIQMPVLNGIEASKIIRATSNVPIIALTAHALSEEKRHILSCGINDYLTKPINEEQIQDAISRFCKLGKQSSVDSNHEVINLDLALQLAKNRANVANELFSMLMQSLPEDIREINRLFHAQSLNVLIDAVHKLHGATCYTGVERLRSACLDLENGLKQESENEYQQLMDKLNTSANEIIAWHETHVFIDRINQHLEMHVF